MPWPSRSRMPTKAIRVGTRVVPRWRISWIVAGLGEGAVLDRIDAGADRRGDAFVGMGVGGDLEAERMGGLDDRAHLGVGEATGRGRGRPGERTPPVAWNLITSAPARASSRTRAAHCSAPVQVLWPSSAAITSGRKPATSPWPPMVESAWPETSMRGPGSSPSSIAAPEREAGGAGRAEVADGGEAGAQRWSARCGRRPGRDIRRSGPPPARTALPGTLDQMDVGVDQAGQHGAVRKVDQPRARAAAASGRRRRAVMRPSTMVMVEGPCSRPRRHRRSDGRHGRSRSRPRPGRRRRAAGGRRAGGRAWIESPG